MRKTLFSRGPLAPSAVLRNLPLLLVIAGVLTVGYMISRQMGHDSKVIQVADMATNETRSYRVLRSRPVKWCKSASSC